MRISRPLYELTGTQVAELLNSNSITVEQYATALLGRIQVRDSTVRAWAYLGNKPPIGFPPSLHPSRGARLTLP